jgi:signal peptidase I
MTDLDTRLRDLERLDPPELWPEIARRVPRALPPQRRRGRVVAVLVAAAAVTAGVVVPLTLLRSNDVREPGSGGQNLIAVTVVSVSMEPTLHVGDVADVDTEAFQPISPPSPGDVIVFEKPPLPGDIIAFRLQDYPNEVFLKRVIGLPGDVVEERNGVMYVNGVAIDVPQPPGQHDTRTLGPWTVEAGHLFVVGDNMVDSNDSRFGLGQVPFGAVIGKVVGVDTGRGGSPSPPPPAGSVSGPAPTPSSESPTTFPS